MKFDQNFWNWLKNEKFPRNLHFPPELRKRYLGRVYGKGQFNRREGAQSDLLCNEVNYEVIYR